ncbi:transmembrane protein 242-like [Mercenaria mercenaria]|uniref:transmembrane protein 242-like n=1 Tax=Mercenaria mercenaria TaxID=6596 RepID=UPI00234F46EE|nr:transmembrane protein 242-like [Mercenaria mercenaria]
MAAPMGEETEKNETPNTSTALKEIKAVSSPDKRNALLFGAASLSVLFGFGVSLYNARRRDPLFFKKMKSDDVAPETGTKLASKALAVATILSVSSFGLMVIGFFKLLGVNDFHEFHSKMREYFPKKETKGRVHFKDLRELADYLISEDRKAELAKNKSAKDQS